MSLPPVCVRLLVGSFEEERHGRRSGDASSRLFQSFNNGPGRKAEALEA